MSKNRLLGFLLAVAMLFTPLAAFSPATARADMPEGTGAILAWNAIARRTSIQVAGHFPQQSIVYISFVQAAVYNAVVAIEGGYQPYKLAQTPRPGASIDAAVATAAHHVLVHYFQNQQGALDADYAAALAAIPDGPAKDQGIQVGQEAAAGIIALRQGDGLEADIGFTMPPAAPGVWQLPAGVAPQTPWVSRLRPFMLDRPDQFRPDPPPALTSAEWARQFDEVKTIGRSTGSTRTPEQTDIARFWTMHPTVQFNNTYAELAQARGLDAMQTARLFAMGNLAGADALIACFDAKYTYLFWRPRESVPMGDSDGNPKTAPDPAFAPLIGTPAHPEYPSAHNCLTVAQAQVFAEFLGTKWIDLDVRSTVANLLQPTRHFDHANDLTREIVSARVWGGIHYRVSDDVGAALGRKVANWTLKRYFLPAN